MHRIPAILLLLVTLAWARFDAVLAGRPAERAAVLAFGSSGGAELSDRVDALVRMLFSDFFDRED